MVGYNRNNLFVKNILDRIIQGNGTIKIDSKKANQFSKVREIRYLRKKDYLYVGRDGKKGKTIIYFKPNLKIKKTGNKFRVDGL